MKRAYFLISIIFIASILITFTSSQAFATDYSNWLIHPNGGQIFAGGSSVNITWNANLLISAGLPAIPISLWYSTTGGPPFTLITSGIANAPGSYTWTIPSNINTTTCRIQIFAQSGNVYFIDESNDVFTIDSTAPIITDVTVINITDDSATITWKTNESSTSYVEYGISTSYGSTNGDDWINSSHSVVLSGLTENTLYHFRVKSGDETGNIGLSSDLTFITQATPSNPSPESGSSNVPFTITLKWACEPTPGASQTTYDVYLEDYPNPTTKKNTTPLSSAEFTVSDLTKNTTYYWKVVASNSNGTATSEVWSFTTVPETGTIKVNTFRTTMGPAVYPVDAPFEIRKDGEIVYSASTDSGGTWETGTLLGDYEITFLPKPGFNTPAPQTLSLSADGATITFVGTYEINDTNAPDWVGGPYIKSIDNSTGTVVLTWEAAIDPTPPDPPSGIMKYVVYFNGKEINVGTATICTITDLKDGTYGTNPPIYVKAYDWAYNTVDSGDIGFTINRYAPTLNLSIKKGSYERKFSADRLDPPVAVSLGSTISLLASDGNGVNDTSIVIMDKEGTIVGSYAETTPSASLDLNDTDIPLKENEIYTISAEATDTGGKKTLISIKIQLFPADVQIINGDPFNYPNPFDPLKGTTIKYYLSDSSDTKIMIYNSVGKPVWQELCTAGIDEGAKQDLNLVVWNGKDNFENYVANGPYLYFIIVDEKVIGKGEMAAFK
jgi:hypothetical protein